MPDFVYGIVVVQFVLFFSFGLNQWLQYRGIGKWTDYIYGEKMYLVLSLAAKSLLAWQIYFPEPRLSDAIWRGQILPSRMLSSWR